MTIWWEPIAESALSHLRGGGESAFANSPRAGLEAAEQSERSGLDLWIGGIPANVLEGTVDEATARLRAMCDVFGETETVTIRKKPGGPPWHSWALVQYAERASIEWAVEAGLTTDDGVVLRVKAADIAGTIAAGESDGVLANMAQYHGTKKQKPGMLHVVVNSGEELAPSTTVISDLSTFVDYKELRYWSTVLFGYILIAFIFYRVGRA